MALSLLLTRLLLSGLNQTNSNGHHLSQLQQLRRRALLIQATYIYKEATSYM